VSAGDGLRGLFHGRVEAEGLGDEVDVVIDGLRNANDADFRAAPGDLLLNAPGRLHGAVAADDKEHAHVVAFQGVGDILGRLRTPARSEHGAAELMDVGHGLRGQLHRGMAVAIHEALQPEPDAEHPGHMVIMMRLHDDGPDHVV